ncbi:MAG: lysozyme inhibitor LprI family protein [Oligoflexia bacterium]|nr:lysozyme inhibitor LprI family protein [Oligoflexia bacterium]
MKKFSIVPFLIFGLPALSSSVLADVASIRAEEKACLADAETNLDMKVCEGNTYQAADKELNATYQKLVAGLKAQAAKEKGIPDYESSAEILRRLIASERAWITFRDADCSFQATSMLGGTGEGLIYLSCEASTTLDRITALNLMMTPSYVQLN